MDYSHQDTLQEELESLEEFFESILEEYMIEQNQLENQEREEQLYNTIVVTPKNQKIKIKTPNTPSKKIVKVDRNYNVRPLKF